MSLRALLIAINQYHPDSRIPPLSGCLNDVQAVRQFLLDHYADQLADAGAIQILHNEQATRANVVAAFRAHLCLAGPEDAVLIYFSGHGAQNMTAPEFQDQEPGGLEEGWVLYDSRLPGQFDLADKEIALLLEEVGRNHPHLVFISDSCHSGSVTRDIEDFSGLRARFIPGLKAPRPLDSYLEGAYARRQAGPGAPQPPVTRHILFSACKHDEKAWESSDKCGLFTQALLEVLRTTGGQIAYGDLYARVCAEIRIITRQQNPQAETHGGFNPLGGFLGRPVPPKSQRRYAVLNKTGRWWIQLGAAAGLRTDINEAVPVDLFDAPTGGTCLGTVSISNINVTESLLDPGGIALSPPITYWGAPAVLPLLPFPVYCPDWQAMEAVQTELRAQGETAIVLSDRPEGCSVELRVEAGNFALYPAGRNQLINGVIGQGPASVQRVVQVLDQLAHWYRIQALEHAATRLPQNAVHLKLYVPDAGTGACLPGDAITLAFAGDPIDFELTVSNACRQALHMALVYLNPRFGMEVLSHVKSPAVAAGTTETSLLKNYFALPDGIDEELDTLKLLVSTEPIDATAFSREDLAAQFEDPETARIKGVTRSIGGLARPDWFTQTLHIRLLRNTGGSRIGAQPLPLAGGQITLAAHPAFRSDYALTTPAATRGLDPVLLDADWLQHLPQAQWLPLANTRGLDTPYLDLSEIQHPEALAEQPLRIHLAPEDADTLVLPFWFDGENFVPIGEAVVQPDGSLGIDVRHIPDDLSTARTRSLGKALRLFCFKFAKDYGLPLHTQELHWVEYGPGGRFERHKTDLPAKITAADHITLLIHGIIGDTKTMAGAFRPAEGENSLVLTFDYENLKTPIEDTALALYQFLHQPEIAAALNGRKIRIVAHSMGGLVARYFIEHLEGHTLVEELVMAGTPNAGSRLGNMPDYLNWAASLMGLGMRYFAWNLPAIAGFIGAVQFAKEQLFVTLEQMKPGSDFLNRLAVGKQATVPYRVIAGDIAQFLALERDPDFWDKVLVQTGRVAYRNVPNDGAMSVESICAVERAEKVVVARHHWGYFEGPGSAFRS